MMTRTMLGPALNIKVLGVLEERRSFTSAEAYGYFVNAVGPRIVYPSITQHTESSAAELWKERSGFPPGRDSKISSCPPSNFMIWMLSGNKRLPE
jgi:hypothetical protein